MILSSKLREEILATIKPTLTEHTLIETEVHSFISKLEESGKEMGLDLSFYIGGSFGKNTYLKGNFDVDLFCRFNSEKYSDDKISFLLQSLLESAQVKYKILKGSRNYFEVIHKTKKTEILFECVPTLDFKNPDHAKNSTDVSHLHVEHVKRNSQKSPQLQDEIRLAKQFFKAKKLYGAESYIEGFSGHVIDLLILHYGSLENLLESAKTWGSRHIVDSTKQFKSESEILKSLEKDKHSTLIITDPILTSRNAARALSEENYFKFILECYTLKSLELDDFIVKKLPISSVIKQHKKFSKKSGTTFIGYKMNFTLENSSEDIIGAKLRRLYYKHMKEISDLDFTVMSSVFEIDMQARELFFGYHLQEQTLPKIKKVQGPPIEKSEAVLNFILDKSSYFVENSRVYSFQLREIYSVKLLPQLTVEKISSMNSSDMTFIVSVKKILF